VSRPWSFPIAHIPQVVAAAGFLLEPRLPPIGSKSARRYSLP